MRIQEKTTGHKRKQKDNREDHIDNKRLEKIRGDISRQQDTQKYSKFPLIICVYILSCPEQL